MNYTVPGEILARLLVAAGSRLDADEIGEIVHGIKADLTGLLVRDDGDEGVGLAEKPAKPEA